MAAARPRDRRSLIDAFILLNVLAICCWSLPLDNSLAATVNQVTAGYLRLTGLWQGWNMFAPDPRSIQIRMDATVTLRDGSRRTWNFPRIDEMSLWERYRKERYRKWAHDNVRLDDNSVTWEPTARFIARQCSEIDNPAVHVALHRHWAGIPLPSESGETVDARAVPFKSYTFYETRFPIGESDVETEESGIAAENEN